MSKTWYLNYFTLKIYFSFNLDKRNIKVEKNFLPTLTR